MKYPFLFIAAVIIAASCKKQTDNYPDPYSGGKQPPDLVFNNASTPVPETGSAGTIVTFSAKGLTKFSREGADRLIFMFNGEEAEIVNITENTIEVKVPENASSGATSVTIGEQVFFGPQFKVTGRVMQDPFYKAKNGTDAWVSVAYTLPDGRVLLGGDFTNYDNQANDVVPIRRIVLTAADGEIDRSYRFGRGTNGRIADITASADRQKLVLAGSFGSYDRMERFINNITTTTYNGGTDTISVPTYTTPVTGRLLGVPVFNGGTNAGILKIFNAGEQIIAVGNFTHYLRRNYQTGAVPQTAPDGSILFKDSVTVDSVPARQLIRFNMDGSLDRTYHFNTTTNTTLEGGNGSVTNAFRQEDGKIILVGNFTRFDGVAANRIVRLNADGTVDNTFKTGSGANSSIYRITFNSVTKKFLLAGNFGMFNGIQANHLVMLNEDGSVDPSFSAKDFSNGFPTFARQISNGLIVVGGSFRKYNNVKRAGFIILNPNGSLAGGYNTNGNFSGTLSDIVERKNPDNKPSLLLLGSVTRFDGQIVNNIISIALD